MKYIISESQYQLLLESKIPPFIRRRATEESLRDYIAEGEREYPTLCSDFDHPLDYSEAVIQFAVDAIIWDYDDDFENDDRYSDIVDYLKSFCRTHFEEYLKKIYIEICSSK